MRSGIALFGILYTVYLDLVAVEKWKSRYYSTRLFDHRNQSRLAAFAYISCTTLFGLKII